MALVAGVAAAWFLVPCGGGLVRLGQALAETPGSIKTHEPAAAVMTGALLDVDEPLGATLRRWPVTVGVPLPPGAVSDPSRLRLHERVADGSELPVPIQSRVLSRWPDGGVRWVLLDWQTDLQPRERRQYGLGVAGEGKSAAAPVAQGTVAVQDTPEGLEVDTGRLQFQVPRKTYAPLSKVRLDRKPIMPAPVSSFLRVGGQRFSPKAPAQVTVSEPGPLRARIELRGDYSAEFGYVVRIDAFANQPFVRILHTFIQQGPQPYTALEQIGLELPITFEAAATYRAGKGGVVGWRGTLPAGGFTLYQEDNEVLDAGGTRQEGRAAGWVNLHDASGGAAVAARFFWQEYPQSFHLRPTGVTYNMWAPEAAPATVGMGTAKTHELFLLFHGETPPAADIMQTLTTPLLARVEPEWTVSSGALPNSLAPGPTADTFLRALAAAHRRYQTHADQERWDDTGRVYCSDPAHSRPRRGFYGMFNWGDWNFPGYHDTTKGCDAWGNLEYDTTQVLALAYAATGERDFYDAMIAAGRHFMDVDRIHYQSKHPSWIGMNHPKNPIHFTFELGGVDLGHTWTEGLLSYYYVTGDERGLAAARGIADYLVRRLGSGVRRGNPRQWGWPQIALVAAYEATGSEAYRNAAHEYARRGMAAYPPDNVSDWKMGILAESLSYTHDITQDPSIWSWLERYAKAVSRAGSTTDARMAPAVAYVGRVTGNRPYLDFAQAAAARLQFGNWGKPFTIAGRLGFRILAQTSAAPTGSKDAKASPAAMREPGGAVTGNASATPGIWESTSDSWEPAKQDWDLVPDPFSQRPHGE